LPEYRYRLLSLLVLTGWLLLLTRSEKDYKFDPTTIGMTETDASKIAKVFAEVSMHCMYCMAASTS
jgi:hypothetical protein